MFSFTLGFLIASLLMSLGFRSYKKWLQLSGDRKSTITIDGRHYRISRETEENRHE